MRWQVEEQNKSLLSQDGKFKKEIRGLLRRDDKFKNDSRGFFSRTIAEVC